ncbi:MAG TPA: AI-2E family transporter [Longimicrobiaceae bacterium]
MMRPESDSWTWRVFYIAALIFVLGGFLFSLRDILNPFLLFVLLAVLVSPFAGSRTHLLLVGVAGLLTVVWILQTTGFLLAPFVLALGLAYIIHPLLLRLESERVSRPAAIGLLSLPVLAAVALVVLVGIPALSQQVARFIASVPELAATLTERLSRLEATLLARDFPFVDEEALVARIRAFDPQLVVSFLEARRLAIAEAAWRGLLGAGRGLGAILTVLGFLVLTPILTYYLLRDWESLLGRLRSLLPRARESQIVAFAREYDGLLARYMRGQLIAAAAVGLLTGIGFWIVGFPYALLLGVTAGVFNVVPYLGLIVSLIPALIIAIFSGSFLMSLLKIAIVFGVVQLLDGSVIGPRIVGDSVGLHPVWVILSLSVAGFFFGFVGLLLAIPLAVLIKLLLRTAVDRYQQSPLFLGQRS